MLREKSEKAKSFFAQYRGPILKLLLLLALVVCFSLLIALILRIAGVIYYDDGIQFNAELFDAFKTAWYGCIIYVLLQCIMSTLLCVIPGVSMAFILIGNGIYDHAWQAFVLSFIGVLVTSLFMYSVGRFGGYRLCEKMLGAGDCQKAAELLRNHGTVYFPLMMAFPVFPDDALTMIAGTFKMKLSWFIPSIVLGRGIGVAMITFGFSLIPFNRFTGFYDWAVFITVCAFWVIIIFKLAHRLNMQMEKKRQRAAEAATEAEEVAAAEVSAAQ